MERKTHERTTQSAVPGMGSVPEELLALKALPAARMHQLQRYGVRFRRPAGRPSRLFSFGQIDGNFEVNLVRLKCLYDLPSPSAVATRRWTCSRIHASPGLSERRQMARRTRRLVGSLAGRLSTQGEHNACG